MKRTDWDDYLDGTMSASQRETLNERLISDATLAKELEGFKAFRSALRDAGLQVGVPSGRLEGALAATVAKPAVPAPGMKWMLRLSPLVAVAIVAAIVYRPEGARQALVDPVAIGQSSAYAALQTTDSNAAAEWIFEKTQIPTPALTMGTVGKLSGARHGKDWGRFDFAVQGHTVHVYVAKSDTFEGAATVSVRGFNYYRGSNGYGWRDNGLSFYADGCASEVLEEAVTAARSQLGSVPDKSPSQGTRARVQ